MFDWPQGGEAHRDRMLPIAWTAPLHFMEGPHFPAQQLTASGAVGL